MPGTRQNCTRDNEKKPFLRKGKNTPQLGHVQTTVAAQDSFYVVAHTIMSVRVK